MKLKRVSILKVIEKKDKWGRSESDKWYGFDPKTKKYTIGDWKGYTAGSKKEALDITSRRLEETQRCLNQCEI